ncbi:hypothetical protein [Serratia sp. 14-2641]|uniref:hypothetical protein n=1 Tax=Serratia sp. 14-2641 TaxID=1841657 RepID=UPI00080FC6AD|nr:hypothetical protein [Serratia sp. 14-2641]OCJ20031.1 hypothetical protein A6U95_15325 [Serratia sp. 14-2641]
MKTFYKIKSLIGYQQTDGVFRDYLMQLRDAEVIEINDGDIVGNNVSDDFYRRLAAVFGVQLDEDLNPIINIPEDSQ